MDWVRGYIASLSRQIMSIQRNTRRPSKPANTALMADSDILDDLIIIHGQVFNTFTALHTFIRKEYPGKLADFERQYGKCSSS